MRLLFVTPDADDNSLGRTYCLWLLAQQGNHESSTVARKGASIWKPLAGSDFAASVSVLPSDRASAVATLAARAAAADVVIAIKPVGDSFGLCLEAQRRLPFPLVLDIDDPDLEVVLGNRTAVVRRIAKWVARFPHMRRTFALRRQVDRFPRFVSNPELQRLYGGHLLPHVRQSRGHVSTRLERDHLIVAFVGTDRAHKGLAVLRAAVAQLASDGFQLHVTADRPGDALSHESWLGTTSLQQGLELVARADIVVIPSLDTPWAWGQLPAKLVDAMIAGVPLVVSRIDPMPWAVGDCGLLVEPGSVPSLVTALSSLRPVERRRTMGDGARRRAEQLFSVAANATVFDQAVASAVAGFKERHR